MFWRKMDTIMILVLSYTSLMKVFHIWSNLLKISYCFDKIIISCVMIFWCAQCNGRKIKNLKIKLIPDQHLAWQYYIYQEITKNLVVYEKRLKLKYFAIEVLRWRWCACKKKPLLIKEDVNIMINMLYVMLTAGFILMKKMLT